MQSSRYQDAAREIGVRDDKAIKEQEKIRLAHEKEELRRLMKGTIYMFTPIRL